MKAVRLHRYGENPRVEEVAEPELTHPLDVIVRIGGAGLCRTDLHIVEGQWKEKSGVALPYTLGHENAGWVAAVGTAVDSVAVNSVAIGGVTVGSVAIGSVAVGGVAVGGWGVFVRGASIRGASIRGVIVQDAQAHGAIWSVTHPSMSRLAQPRLKKPLRKACSCPDFLGRLDPYLGLLTYSKSGTADEAQLRGAD